MRAPAADLAEKLKAFKEAAAAPKRRQGQRGPDKALRTRTKKVKPPVPTVSEEAMAAIEARKLALRNVRIEQQRQRMTAYWASRRADKAERDAWAEPAQPKPIKEKPIKAPKPPKVAKKLLTAEERTERAKLSWQVRRANGNHKHTPETKALMSASMRKAKTEKRVPKARPPMPDVTRAAISAANKGRPRTEEVKAKMRATKAKYTPEERSAWLHKAWEKRRANMAKKAATAELNVQPEGTG